MRLLILLVLMFSFCATFAINSFSSFTNLQWDEIEKSVQQDVKESATELIEQARLVENIAKTHIGATIRANAFEALKVVVNNAVKKSIKNPKRRVSRQDEDEDETPELDSEEEKQAAQVEYQNAIKINENVFSFIGQTVKEVVSGITGTPVSSLGATAEGTTVKRKKPAYNYNPAAPYKLTRSENVTFGDFFEKNEQLFRKVTTDTNEKPYSEQFMELVEILSSNSASAKNSSQEKLYIKDSVDEVLRYQPWLLPDLYKGAGELKGYVYTVEKLVNQLNNKLNRDQQLV